MKQQLEILSEVLEIELSESDLATKLSDIDEWDSIAGLGLMVQADDVLNKTLTPDQLEAAQTVNDLVKLLEV